MQPSQLIATIAKDPAFQARMRALLTKLALANKSDPALAGLVGAVLRDLYNPERIALAILTQLATNPTELAKLTQAAPDNGITDAMIEATATPMIPLLKQVLGV